VRACVCVCVCVVGTFILSCPIWQYIRSVLNYYLNKRKENYKTFMHIKYISSFDIIKYKICLFVFKCTWILC